MKCINNIIIESEEAYKNSIELSNGSELVINSTIESVEHINRIGTVVSAPKSTILKKGDEVIVHHNIMRLRNGTDHKVVQSDYYIKNNLYFVPFTEVYAYKRKGDWIVLDPYVFVKPIKFEFQEESKFVLNIKEYSYKGNKKNKGIIKYINKQLKELGVKQGDEVVFSKDSEYEFKIDDEVYYLMNTNDILAKIK